MAHQTVSRRNTVHPLAPASAIHGEVKAGAIAGDVSRVRSDLGEMRAKEGTMATGGIDVVQALLEAAANPKLTP